MSNDELQLEVTESQSQGLSEIVDWVTHITGVQLQGKDKRLLVETRMLRRARQLGLSSVEDYLEYFRENQDSESRELISVLTTHTTEFFRESEHFDYLFEKVFPELLKNNRKIRIWSAASSTGEEIYSLAISVIEFLRAHDCDVEKYLPFIEIVGSDVDLAAIEKAREGVFDRQALRNLPPRLQEEYFDFGDEELSHLVRIKDFVHDLCTFKKINLNHDPYSVGKVDIIFARNVFIYFTKQVIKDICFRFYDCLNEGGYLFLGHSETIPEEGMPFRTVGHSVYKSVPLSQTTGRTEDSAPKAPLLPVRSGPTRVLIIDDSATIRKILAKIISKTSELKVVGEASNPIEADEILKNTEVDLLTLDIHMPEMDGITYLETKGKTLPPAVIISSISYDDAVRTLKCFELGAVDYIEKPEGLNLEREADRIRDVLINAGKSHRRTINTTARSAKEIQYIVDGNHSDLILIGASTGGTEAIKYVLGQFPMPCPPVLIVQHIPPIFSKAFADRVNSVSRINVKEAEDGELIQQSTAYIAPGGRHMKLRKAGKNMYVDLCDDAPVNRHRPSVDVLFESVAKTKFQNSRISAGLLTGMGNDGALGLKSLKLAGWYTLAESEESCVVYGMPKEAVSIGAVIEEVPLMSVPYHLFKPFNR